MPHSKKPFWERKTLERMSPSEWERLCDQCGRCCLVKLEDEDTGELYFTDVACKLLNRTTCRCSNYDERTAQVPDCLVLSPDTPEYYNMLPDSCAYRRLSRGQALADWHPLISGSKKSVHEAGISVRGLCVAEETVDPADWEDHIIELYDQGHDHEAH